MSGLFSLNIKDFVHGLIFAVILAVATWIMQISKVENFDFTTINWQQMLQIAVMGAIGYLAEKFMSDKKDNPLGMKIGDQTSLD